MTELPNKDTSNVGDSLANVFRDLCPVRTT